MTFMSNQLPSLHQNDDNDYDDNNDDDDDDDDEVKDLQFRMRSFTQLVVG